MLDPSCVILPGLILLAGLLPSVPAADRPPAPPAPATLTGRVVDLATNLPIAGAEVVVAHGARAGLTARSADAMTTRTDAAGRFALTLPAGSAADPDMHVRVLRVDHPDFIPRAGRAEPLAPLVAAFRLTGRSPLDAIALERGEVHTARVVNPDGSPAAGVPASFWNDARRDGNPSEHFVDAFEERTDADGRLRLRMPAVGSLCLRLTPEHVAPYRHWWGKMSTPAGDPEATVPPDLGAIRLEPGAVVAGRLLDEWGRPVAGQALTASGRFNEAERVATTAGAGRFAFAPLAPGNYVIAAAGQDAAFNPDEPARSIGAAVLRPRPIFFEAGESPAPLELRAAPSVTVQARFVDSAGRPARGGRVLLSGALTVAREDASTEPLIGPAAPPNGPEQWYTDDENVWGADAVPDAAGLVELRAPIGLRGAGLSIVGQNPAYAYRARTARDAPLDIRALVPLGDLRAGGGPMGIEFVQYRAPTVIARLSTEDGEPVPPKVEVHEGYNRNGGDYGGTMLRQPDGQYRTQSLLPDFEYEISAWAVGYVPQGVVRLTLAEGATAEVDLVLRRKPIRPLVGDLAPPFAVTTTDGQLRTLPDHRGKHLLIHLWSPFFRRDAELARVDAVGRRVGADRLAVLGLVITADVPAATRAIAGAQLAWPQAILRDRGADPMVLDYDAMYPPRSILIGPDGTVLAPSLQGEAIEQFLGLKKE